MRIRINNNMSQSLPNGEYTMTWFDNELVHSSELDLIINS